MASEIAGLKQLFPQLVARLQASDIIDQLYQSSLVTEADHEGFVKDISQKSDLRDVNRRILIAVRKGPTGSVAKFEEILRASQPDLADEFELLRAQRQRGRSASMPTINEDTTLQYHHDDMPHSRSSSVPNPPLPSAFDPVPMSQPNLPMEERVAKLETQLEKAMSCLNVLISHLKEHSSQMEQHISQMEKHASRMEELTLHIGKHTACKEEHSLPMKELSSPLKEHPEASCMEEQSLLAEDLSSKTQLEVFQTPPLLHDGPTLLSEKLPDLPMQTACATAVVIDRKVYVCGGRCDDVESSRQVHVYCLNTKTWSTLSEPAPQYRCEAIAIINRLALIGGREASSHKITNIISTWMGHRWQQDIPAMPSKRVRPAAIVYDKYTIVAGGMSEHNHALLSSIDILDTSTLQWWTPTNFQLPQPMSALNITVCSAHVYVAAATIDYDISNNEKTPSNKAWQLPVDVLEEVLTVKKISSLQRCRWKEIAPTPKNHSTLLKSSTHPVAVGGSEIGDRSGCNSTCNISVYDPEHDQWSTVGQLLEPRARCAVVYVSESSFLVCGGYSDTFTDPQPRLSSVELLSVHK